MAAAAAGEMTSAVDGTGTPPSLPPIPVVPSSATSRELLFNCRVNAEDVFTGHTDSERAAWHEQKNRELKRVNAQLLARLTEKERSRYAGKGCNKQTWFNTDQEDLANKAILYQWTKEEIWPMYKFLFFNGDWTTWPSNKQPHPFAAAVMDVIRVPTVFEGDEGVYYTDKALPFVWKKMTNLRGNVVKAMKTSFESKCRYNSSMWYLSCPLLTHIAEQCLHPHKNFITVSSISAPLTNRLTLCVVVPTIGTTLSRMRQRNRSFST